MTTLTTPVTDLFEALRARLRGTLLLPGDAGYDEASRAWNLEARQHPALVVMAESAADVVAAVRFARDMKMGIGVMATGHGVGAPCDGGLLLNTSRMRGVHVDPVSRTARVEAGAQWKDVIPPASAYGLAGLTGSAPHVGVVGYTMGGGFGYLGRRYGLNSASVTQAEMVTAGGELVRLSDGENADLFWGLKGGAGNFGIVTALSFRLYPLTTVYGGAVFYPVENARKVLGRFADWSAELPDEITAAFAFMNIPPLPLLPEPLRGRSVVVVRGCYCGEHPEQGEELFSPVRHGLGSPIMDTFQSMPVSAMDTITKDPVDPMGIIQHTGMLSDLSPTAIDALVEVAGAGSGSPLLMVEFRRLGGALAHTSEYPNPMGSGGARYSMNVLGATFSPQLAESVKAHIARLAAATSRHRTGATFLNFMELNPTEDRVRAAYSPQDWERLVALKSKYDPANLFRFNRNIPPRPDDVGSRYTNVLSGPGIRSGRKEQSTMKTILVTGATGSVGSHVVRELQQRGASVRALVRDTDKAAEMLGDGVELASGDFADVASVRRALAGVQGVFLACANNPRQVEYETNVIDAAAAMGIRRIVKLSACGAEVGSQVAFWDWHARIEQHLQASGIPAVVLRPTFNMTNLFGSAEHVRQMGSLFAPADGARVAMIDPRDVAVAAAVALTEDGHDGETYVLTGPQAITFEHVAEDLSAVAGQRIRFVAIPDEAAQQAMADSGTPEFVAVQIVAVFGHLRRGDQDLTTDAVRALAGRAPSSFATFARDHAGMFRSN